MKKRIKKDVKINIKPFHAEIRTHEKGFVWSFHAPINGQYGRKKIINIHCERWWIAYLAKDLKEVIESEKTELNRLIELVGFKDNES